MPAIPVTTGNGEGRRLLWRGPLFGRLSKAGQDYLIRRGGWELIEHKEPTLDNSGQRLQFVWPNKSGPQFEKNDHQAAHIRPYPKAATDLLDDKICLAKLLETHAPEIAPGTIASPKESKEGKRYFVKHRFGAQGKSVYVYNKSQLEEWWNRSNNPQDFVIQKEVPPALDPEGRKFVLRCHILILQRTDKPLQAFLHEHIICLPHATPYVTNDEHISHEQTPKSAYISQAGKKHPPPVLLQDLLPSHPAAALGPSIRDCAERLVSAACHGGSSLSSNKSTPTNNPSFFHAPLAEATACFALLGVDLLVSSGDGQQRVLVCEVNSHPALGWGTMLQVPSAVFRGLVEDTLSIVVLDDYDRTCNKFEVLQIQAK